MIEGGRVLWNPKTASALLHSDDVSESPRGEDELGFILTTPQGSFGPYFVARSVPVDELLEPTAASAASFFMSQSRGVEWVGMRPMRSGDAVVVGGKTYAVLLEAFPRQGDPIPEWPGLKVVEVKGDE